MSDLPNHRERNLQNVQAIPVEGRRVPENNKGQVYSRFGNKQKRIYYYHQKLTLRDVQLFH